MKKILVLDGSPRVDGDSRALLGELLAHLPEERHIIRAYDGLIAPCNDCRACWKAPGCAIQDDMQRVYGLLDACDHVVISSPIYFSELTGPLLSMGSRLQTYWAARFFRGERAPEKKKTGALILAGGGDGSPERAGARRTPCLNT